MTLLAGIQSNDRLCNPFIKLDSLNVEYAYSDHLVEVRKIQGMKVFHLNPYSCRG